ncbi:MAG: molybdenum cofactor biosynthesis protein A [Spirochaetes bacterium ADurb.Bin218]|jgi:spiro-SPASM protein|nr:MAG: molybdenum cofactor biosynthesis protein A [Spirochaetes bacterium ADurb.Bin218]
MKSENFDVLIHIESNTLSDELISFNNKLSTEIIAERVAQNFPQCKIFYSIPANYNGTLLNKKDIFIREGNEDVPFWKNLFEKTESKNIAIIKADSAFFDPEILREMIEVHVKYLAEFTYSENLPEGFACEIISTDLMENIPDIKEKTLPLSQVIKSNINLFDVELFYKEPDIREKRLSFRVSNPRDKAIMERILSLKQGTPSYSEIKEIIDNNPEILFLSPSYIEIEICGSCDLDCIFCYRKSLKKEHPMMEISTFQKILSEMKAYNLPYTLSLGGSGEPLMHPQFYSMLSIACGDPLVERIIIETNGIYADTNFKTFLQKPESQKISVIINNNALDKDSYIRLHGADRYDTVFKNITSLAELNKDGERIYLQIMKINETDEIQKGEQRSYLDRYYDFWESQKFPIILQKQNIYLGKIKDRRYSDLSPLKRIPCWHLQRDLYILADGTVSFCKQDIDGDFSRGNITNESLEDILKNQKQSFIEGYKFRFPVNPDCSKCDEWYTFNF